LKPLHLRPVAKGGQNGAKRSTVSAKCSHANRWHHNTSFMLSQVCLTQLVVGLYSLLLLLA